MHSPRTYAMAAALALCAPGAAPAQEVTVESVADNTLYESAGGFLSNGAGPVCFAGVDGAGRLKRALLRFDLSAIPAGSTVLEAELSLTMNRSISGPATIDLHRASQAWGEGTSVAPGEGGGGAPATPGDATWLHTFFDTARWDSEGGDFAPEVSASTEVGQLAGVFTWSSAGTAADVQMWVDDPASNHGWLLKGADETALASAKRFATREGAAGTRPSLRIVYEPGGCYADCDGSASLDFFDFLCFQNQFAAGDPQADCDTSGSLDFFDFLCFQNAFAAGC